MSIILKNHEYFESKNVAARDVCRRNASRTNYRRFRAHVLVAAFWATFLVQAPLAQGQANIRGTWHTLSQTMPINPVHAALLSNGKILVVSGSGNYPPVTTYSWGVWNPATKAINVKTQTWDAFCNGMIALPDGRPFVVGGNLQYDPFHGWNRTEVYDPATGKMTDMQDMAHGRWYPTTTVLGDGRVMTFSGLDENGNTNSQVEIYKVGVGWGAPIASSWNPPLYPRMHLLPSGKVFVSGASTQSRTFDPSSNTWSGVVATTLYGSSRVYGSSVLLPLTPANGYKPKVIIFGGGNPSTATTETIDLSAATPAWVSGPPMSEPRIEMNATLLPNGKVLTMGGSLNDEDTNTASLQADLYDSATNTMGSAGSNAFPRLYHSVSLLLPDGTVWVAGGNPTRGTYEQHIEIYTPPYLYNSNGTLVTRPSTTSISPAAIGYGTSLQVQTPDAANISSVVLMKNGSVTHAFDMDQRMVGLKFTKGAGVLNVTGPPDGDIAPPGYYMLFLLNSTGVPSVATIVQVLKASTDVPPVGRITSPASDILIAPGQSVTFAGSGTAASGSIVEYSWSLRGGTPATSLLANPGAVTFPTAGVYPISLTVTDTAGNTDPSPPVRTIRVAVAAAPVVTAVSPSSGNQGTTNLSVTISGSNFLNAPTCSFGAGITVNSCAYVSSTKITASLAILSSATTGTRNVSVTNTDRQSSTLTNAFTVQAASAAAAGSPVGINFSSGFSAGSMALNGNAAINGATLVVTPNAQAMAGSAWFPTPVNIQSFTTDFSFQDTAGVNTADGMTFTIQGSSTAALGGSGGKLGYGNILNSVAVKFDLYSNAGEGPDTTGLYVNGSEPSMPAVDMSTSGIDLHNGHVFKVHIRYDGSNLTMTITDATTAAVWTHMWPVNIPGMVGGTTAHVGFTGGTGGYTALQRILNWTMTSP